MTNNTIARAKGIRPIKVLRVIHLPYSHFLNTEGKSLVDAFNANPYEQPLYLRVYESYWTSPLDTILGEGRYVFVTEDFDFLDLLNDCTDYLAGGLITKNDVKFY